MWTVKYISSSLGSAIFWIIFSKLKFLKFLKSLEWSQWWLLASQKTRSHNSLTYWAERIHYASFTNTIGVVNICLWQRQSFDIFEAHVYRLFNEKITSNPKTSNYRKIQRNGIPLKHLRKYIVTYPHSLNCTQNQIPNCPAHRRKNLIFIGSEFTAQTWLINDYYIVTLWWLFACEIIPTIT